MRAEPNREVRGRHSAAGRKGQVKSNRLLLGLWECEPEAFNQHLQFVHLRKLQVLWKPGATPDYVYFPLDCVVALSPGLANDGSAISGIGSEGMLDVSVVLRAGQAALGAYAEQSGCAYRMATDELLRLVDRDADIRRLLQTYFMVRMMQVGQEAACSKLHRLEQRLCSYLRFAVDRTGSPRLCLTHDEIARALGVRRDGVMLAVGALNAAGLIDNGRGRIHVDDLAGLTRRCCECYAVVSREYDQLWAETERVGPWAARPSMAGAG
jgi:CRP-like cAMP-binding protein